MGSIPSRGPFIIFIFLMLLSFLVCLPLTGAFFISFFGENSKTNIRQIGLLTSGTTFVVSLFLWVLFDAGSADFQFVVEIPWLSSININLVLGLDGISLFFVILTTLFTPICLLASWDLSLAGGGKKSSLKLYWMAFLILESFVLFVFVVLDLLLFYIGFEAVLLPMFFIIGIFGSRSRKVRASFFFFLYTLLGSVFLLLSFALLYSETGTTDLRLLAMIPCDENRQILLWFGFFIAFSVKVPIVPFHIWLPEAHVEAPTAGSVFLAAILLKLGT